MSGFFGTDYNTKQEEAARRKRAELDAVGISAESLLNEANLRKWIEQDKLTYAKIARDYVGCDWKLVSLAAKQYGIVNNNSNFRHMYAARKRVYG
jgi:hypothetical protein